MASLKKHTLTCYAFQLNTPIYSRASNTLIPDVFNHEFFSKFLNIIIQSNRAKHLDGAKYFHLISYSHELDEEIFNGKIHTTRYGTMSDIIDVQTDNVVNQLEPGHGVKNEINFVINPNNGLLLVQNDPFRIFSRSFLFEYLKYRELLASDIIKEYNDAHSDTEIYEQFTFQLSTIHDEGFYDRLAAMDNIKSFNIEVSVDKINVNNALQRFSKEDAPDSEFIEGITDVSYSFKNKLRNQGITKVKRFIENAIDMEKIDGLKAIGKANGKEITAEFKVKPQSYPVLTTKNNHGILDQTKIIENMIKLAKDIS